jgi:hypothetical protein
LHFFFDAAGDEKEKEKTSAFLSIALLAASCSCLVPGLSLYFSHSVLWGQERRRRNKEGERRQTKKKKNEESLLAV